MSDSGAAPILRINPTLDLAPYAQIYAQRGIVQIPGVLEPACAEVLAETVAKATPWRVLFTDKDDNPIHFSPEELQAMGKERFQALAADALARARQNRGYFYDAYPMIEAYLKGWDPGNPIHQVTEFINSPEYLDLGRRVTGVSGITKADAHATRYRPGHFLTRHLDYGEDRERRAAYVLGLTKGWEPDWGGLLLFLNQKQDVTEGYLPRFNVLTIFDIKYLHTVTQVTTFAGANRISVTGWFRDDPAAVRS
ncbi:MAG: proline hydroxylase [Alphaproteobacteria bacterium]|nr:proline hydroxylase [Alphaproteobacteria bacterium]